MTIKEDIEDLKTKAEELEKESFAMELLKDYKKQNLRLFWIWIITFIALIITCCYLVYLTNDIGISDETIDIQDVDTIDNSHIKIGDEYGKSTNN